MPFPRSCRLFLFDLDGTLIDSSEDIARALNSGLLKTGRRALALPDVIRFVGEGMDVLIRRALREVTGMEPEAQEIRTVMQVMLEEYHARPVASSRLYPGVRETLAALRWARFGLVSNKTECLCRRILEAFHLSESFCIVLGSDSLPWRKPDPAPLLKAMIHCGAQTSETVMVGDSRTDVLAGKAAGIFTCGLSCGFRGREELAVAGCDLIIDSFAQLQEYFVPPSDHHSPATEHAAPAAGRRAFKDGE